MVVSSGFFSFPIVEHYKMGRRDLYQFGLIQRSFVHTLFHKPRDIKQVAQGHVRIPCGLMLVQGHPFVQKKGYQRLRLCGGYGTVCAANAQTWLSSNTALPSSAPACSFGYICSGIKHRASEWNVRCDRRRRIRRQPNGLQNFYAYLHCIILFLRFQYYFFQV